MQALALKAFVMQSKATTPGSHVITAAEAGKISPDEASMAVMLTYRNTQNPSWLVSPAGWASVMSHVVTPESGAIMTNAVQANLFGSPVYLSYELPEDVLAVHGSFSQACAYGTKSRGVKIISSDTRAMEFDATRHSLARCESGWNNHSPAVLHFDQRRGSWRWLILKWRWL
jgi:hypothetical protein